MNDARDRLPELYAFDLPAELIGTDHAFREFVNLDSRYSELESEHAAHRHALTSPDPAPTDRLELDAAIRRTSPEAEAARTRCSARLQELTALVVSVMRPVDYAAAALPVYALSGSTLPSALSPNILLSAICENLLTDGTVAGPLLPTTARHLDGAAFCFKRDDWAKWLASNGVSSPPSGGDTGPVVQDALRPEATDDRSSATSGKVSQSAVDCWYKRRAAELQQTGPGPSRDDDAEAARRHFKGRVVTRKQVRDARNAYALKSWKSPGKRTHAKSHSMSLAAFSVAATVPK